MIEVVIIDNEEDINPQILPSLLPKFIKSIDGNGQII
jgi:hypothetical protein